MKKKFDTFLFMPALALIVYGIVMIFSASAPTAALSPACNYDPFFFLKRHLMWLGIGLAAMIFAYKMDLNWWRKLSLPFVGLTILLLVGVLLFGQEVLGAKRWLQAGPFTFQPSELAKIALIFYLADALARRKEQVRNFLKLLTVIAIFGAVVVLIEKQPDLGTTIALGATFLGMLFLAGAQITHLAGMTIVGLVVAVSRIMNESYRIKRIMVFRDPWADPQGMGYQIIQSFIALGSGGPFGLGLGESRQKYFYLPEKFTDFIFAITGEELGLVYGTIPIVILFIILLYKGLRTAANARDPFMCLLAGGITFQIVFQAFINMGVVSGILPCTGIPLPFISFGGSSLLFTLFSLGLLLNVAGEPRRKTVHRDDPHSSRHRFGPRESVVHESKSLSEKEMEKGQVACLQCESSSLEEEPGVTYTPP